jgi:glycosyltransferase involved in cell wall biosynthesis
MTKPPGDQLPAVAGLRIAIVNWRDPWHPDAGGAERYAWEMARGLLSRGARVSFITARAPGQLAGEQRDGVHIVRMGKRFTVYPRVLCWFALHRRSFDIVLDCESGIPFFTPWVMPARVPVLLVMHHVHDAQFGVHFSGPVALLGRVLEGPVSRWTYRRCDGVAVSDSTVGAMRRRLGWRGPVHIIPNGLSPDSFVVPRKTAEAMEATGASDSPAGRSGPVRLVWLGRLVAHKRVERVLDLASRLNGTGATIDVIGRGPAAGPLTQQIADRGLGGCVRLHGYLSEDAKKAVVAGALLHINTSQGEGWGLCVLEAAALGVPTVAYDVDGLRDAVRDGTTGWLVREHERLEDVAERALKELADPVRRGEISDACRSWARQFDWDRSAELMSALITVVVRRQRQAIRTLPASHR